MPTHNDFRHQPYPTQPNPEPRFCRLEISDGADIDFSQLHHAYGIRQVVLVHGTFMGDDPFAVAEIMHQLGESQPALQKPLSLLSAAINDRLQKVRSSVTGDRGNYTDDYRELFQQLVGTDPEVCLLHPTWSGQNHHLARADLAVRLLCHLDSVQPTEADRILFWGHSHAGNGFALLSNLLANHRAAVAEFFEAAGQDADHWQRAAEILAAAPAPHPWAASVVFAAFGTPVRYGWDPDGYRQLIHLLHHRRGSDEAPFRTQPLFPPHRLHDMTAATWGDWVQAFAIAGTDVSPPTSKAVNRRLNDLLEAGLEPPELTLDVRLVASERLRNLCARWKTGTRCHQDGLNLLLEYVGSGLQTPVGTELETSVFGHGVATTHDWLPAHLALLMQHLHP
ncbi:MAG: hypothetical protein R3C49_15635 [Planctomycetaceae bacterium]